MRHGLNELAIRDVRYLLVGVSSSHLAGLAEGYERGRQALAEWRTGSEAWATSYDLDALFAPIWKVRTLCGLEWIEMESGDGPPFDRVGISVHVPSCRNCLRIVSRDLESITPDDRIPLIVGFVVDEVLAEAGTVVTGVPGDQLEPLRSAIRRRLRSFGVPFRTYPLGGDLHVVSEELWDDMPEDRKAEIGAQAAEAVADAIQGRTTRRRGIDWGTWEVF
ncbi:MAG: hypothetical protein P1T08_03230 [Acidimicrobiia bacterium]|nr:hypothetical protein [Acidimicrobiia bacterium]